MMVSSAFSLGWMTLIVLVAAFLQGNLGIGFGLLAAPLLLLIDPDMSPASVIIAMLLLTAVTVSIERADVDMDGFKGLLPGLMVGTIAALAALPYLAGVVHRITGAIVLGAAILSLASFDMPRGPRMFHVFGAFAGFTGTISSMHGPALAIAFQHAAPATARATIALVFVAACTASLAGLAWVGALARDDVMTGAVLLPGVLAGYGLSRLRGLRLPERLIRPLVLVTAGTGGLVLLLR